MTSDDEIAVALRAVDPSSMIPTKPGMVALLRSRVDSAVDPEAAARWIAARGGYLGQTDPIRSRSLGRRFGQIVEPAAEFYAVPRDALAA